MFSVLDNLTPFMLGALTRARQVSQSVIPSAVKLLNIYYPEYALVIHPEKVASRKHVGNGPHNPGYLPIGTYTPIGSIGIRW